MDRDQIVSIAESMGMKKASSETTEEVAYYIIDHSAISFAHEEASKEEERMQKSRAKRGERKERGNRKNQKEKRKDNATPTADGKAAESQEPKTETPEPAAVQGNLFPDTIPGLEDLKMPVFPKKRGRKSKAQIQAEAEAMRKYEEAVAAAKAAQAAKAEGEGNAEETRNESNLPAVIENQPQQNFEGEQKQGKRRGRRKKSEVEAEQNMQTAYETATEAEETEQAQDTPVASPSMARSEIATEQAEEQRQAEQEREVLAQNQEEPVKSQRKIFTPRDSKYSQNKPTLDSFFGGGKGKTFKPRGAGDDRNAPQPGVEQHTFQPQEPKFKEPQFEPQRPGERPMIPPAPVMLQEPGANSQTPKDQNMMLSGKHLSKRQRQQMQRQMQQKQRFMAPYNFDGILTTFGVLEIAPEGFGYLRSSDYNYLPSPDDVYVSAPQIKEYGLKTGDVVEAAIRPPMHNEKYYPLTHVISINGLDPALIRDRVAFEHLVPLFPDEKFDLTKGKFCNISTRVVDMFAPIGKGQRALIVAPPKTGKTILLKDIANVISENHPDTYIIMLLIDERPEEVTDMARSVNAEVIASTFDEPAEQHVKIADMVLQKAKRLVECGHDVVIMLDSITRLARAFNTVSPASGKILSGGVDANALQRPKRFFGAARNIENGGSLTIIATALTETSSKMDEVIFEEFKGTGNMELQLDRKLSNKRIFPAVDIIASSTRRDDLLLSEETTNRMWILRNYLADMNPQEAMEFIKKRMEMTRTNEELLVTMDK